MTCTTSSAGGSTLGVDAAERVWPALRSTFREGDIAAVLGQWDGPKFDTVCAFDIWEHLHPLRLDDYISAVVGATTDDALFAFVIPAYGLDAVFGEPFPLDFEENRAAFDERRPVPVSVCRRPRSRDSCRGSPGLRGHRLLGQHVPPPRARAGTRGGARRPQVDRLARAPLDPLVLCAAPRHRIGGGPGSVRSPAAVGATRGLCARCSAAGAKCARASTFDQPLLTTAKAWYVTRPGVVPALVRARERLTHAR